MMELDKELLDEKVHIPQHQMFYIVHTKNRNLIMNNLDLKYIYTFDLSIKRKICNSRRNVFGQSLGHPRVYPIFGSYLNCRLLSLVIVYFLKHERHI